MQFLTKTANQRVGIIIFFVGLILVLLNASTNGISCWRCDPSYYIPSEYTKIRYDLSLYLTVASALYVVFYNFITTFISKIKNWVANG